MPKSKSNSHSKRAAKPKSKAKRQASSKPKLVAALPATPVVGPVGSHLTGWPGLWARVQIPAEWRRLAVFAAVGLALIGGGAAMAFSLPQATHSNEFGGARAPRDLSLEFASLSNQIRQLNDEQSQLGLQVVNEKTLQGLLSDIELQVTGGNYLAARNLMVQLRSQLSTWGHRLALQKEQPPVVVPATEPPGSHFIPIVIYHYTPNNFETQLEVLEQRGYTTVTLSQVADALVGGAALPAKPVVITFDDGFANQMEAFGLLKHHNMRATYYIINGGVASRWCIGAGRRFGDPLQPPSGCGDAYLTWSQVRELDASGLITIGGHTLDHSDLPTLSYDDQRHEILDSKVEIEQQIGHSISDFAYPYGRYNATTIGLVQAAGYRTAVTTLPGSYQTAGGLYTLRRVRDTLSLP